MNREETARSAKLELDYLTTIDSDVSLLDIEIQVRTGEKLKFSKKDYLCGTWADKNWLNIPGPFYGAETDTCCAGIEQAPYNVLIDANGLEVVFRQPRNWLEFSEVRRAAYSDPFSGYSCDGNQHWTLSRIQEWWHQRDMLVATVEGIKDGVVKRSVEYYSDLSNLREWDDKAYWTKEANEKIRQRYYSVEGFLRQARYWQVSISEWEAYIHDGMEEYLRVYAFFVDNGRLPQENDLLPDV